MLIREKSAADAAACLDLLMQVHQRDGYPLYLPDDVPTFITSEQEAAAWVAEREGHVVGHVALHEASGDPTVVAAEYATGLAAHQLALVARLFTAPNLRGTGLGRQLLRHATGHARSLGKRAVLDVGRTLNAPVALYESEGWTRVDALELPLDEDNDKVLSLWVYVSPES